MEERAGLGRYANERSRDLGPILRSLVACTVAAQLAGCTTVPLTEMGELLSEDQVVDLMDHPERWIGRTITMQIYPYDNGYRGSYVACLEACDAVSQEESVFVFYTESTQFRDASGQRPAIINAVFGKICPDAMPLCLDAPIRIFALRDAD